MNHIISFASEGYPVFIFALRITMLFFGERWWPATLLLFSPRWLAALPLLILLPFATFSNCRLLIPLLASAVIVFGPFMGLSLRKTVLNPARKGLLDAETAHRLRTSREVSRSLDILHGPKIKAGDFNMPVEGAICRESWNRYTNAFSKTGSGLTTYLSTKGWTSFCVKQGLMSDRIICP